MRSPLLALSTQVHTHERLLRSVCLFVGAALLISQWFRICARPQAGFRLHWELGRRLWAGESLYAGGHDYVYAPFWGLIHAPFTVVSLHAAQIAIYPLFLLAGIALFVTLSQLSRQHWPLSRGQSFWLSFAVLALCSRFLLRDAVECGANLALVTLSWLGLLCWIKGRDSLGGVCLGLAIALKLTPAALLAYLVWKRQWKMAGVTIACATLLLLAPLPLMGPAAYYAESHCWLEHLYDGLVEPDPSRGVLGEETVNNIALRPALARYLMHLPATHDGRIDHPAYVDFLNLSPSAASWIIRSLMLAMALAVAWRFRGAVTDRSSPQILWELAAMQLAMLLYSPITWGQHCVGLIPVFYLLVRSWLATGSISRLAQCVLVAYVVLILVLNRSLLGQTGTLVFDSYRPTTFLLLAWLVVVLGMPAEKLPPVPSLSSP